MKRIFLTLLLVLSTSLVYADGGCKKCERVREFHKNHPSKYKFYEDYQEAVNNGDVDPDEFVCPIEFSEEKEAQNDEK